MSWPVSSCAIRNRSKSGIKYLLFGAMTSAVMLFGFSFLFGFTGTTNLYPHCPGLSGGAGPARRGDRSPCCWSLVGFGFKISAVPFHFWAPDVYEGAPTPVAGFLSTASKAAGFAVLMRVLLVAFRRIRAGLDLCDRRPGGR